MENISKEIIVPATLDELDNVLSMVEGSLEDAECPMKLILQIAVCVEEVFVNVVNYAYCDEMGDCNISIKIEKDEEKSNAVITVSDKGLPFNPLDKEDPDITLSADEREIGGLGIFMVKKTMDKIFYANTCQKNVLIMEKSW